MSHHYSASQFNDSFRPIRLKNYSAFTNTPPPYGVHAMCLKTRQCATQIIAHDNGHLFECVSRGASSPWGDYATSIWERTNVCLCIDKVRHPEKYTVPKPIFIAREEPCHKDTSRSVARFLNENPGAFQQMAEKQKLGCGGGDPACCTTSFCKGVPMKVVCVYTKEEKMKLMKEMKRQQREWRRCVAGIRGKNKGQLPFCPKQIRAITLDKCKRKGDFFKEYYGCTKN